MSKQVKFECVFEKKKFVNKETGESYPYYGVNAFIDGQPIKLQVSKDSKQLLNYLMQKYDKE